MGNTKLARAQTAQKEEGRPGAQVHVSGGITGVKIKVYYLSPPSL